jgi:hypothetical protein
MGGGAKEAHARSFYLKLGSGNLRQPTESDWNQPARFVVLFQTHPSFVLIQVVFTQANRQFGMTLLVEEMIRTHQGYSKLRSTSPRRRSRPSLLYLATDLFLAFFLLLT